MALLAPTVCDVTYRPVLPSCMPPRANKRALHISFVDCNLRIHSFCHCVTFRNVLCSRNLGPKGEEAQNFPPMPAAIQHKFACTTELRCVRFVVPSADMRFINARQCNGGVAKCKPEV